jgi:hypothetical protein
MINLLERYSRESPECLGNFNRVKRLQFEKCFICLSKDICRDEEDKTDRLGYLFEHLTKTI